MIHWNTDSLKFIRECNDNEFQLILTDPPYDFDERTIWNYHREFKRICKGDIIIFCPPENQWVIPGEQCKFMFWCKASSTKNYTKNYGRFVEMICRYEGKESKFNSDLHWSNYTGCYNDIVQTLDGHPYKKPLSLIERFILIHTDEEDKILDPFAGSGTVNECAERLKRKCVGIEIGSNEGEGRIL